MQSHEREYRMRQKMDLPMNGTSYLPLSSFHGSGLVMSRTAAATAPFAASFFRVGGGPTVGWLLSASAISSLSDIAVVFAMCVCVWVSLCIVFKEWFLEDDERERRERFVLLSR